jgi:hypothetical protein
MVDKLRLPLSCSGHSAGQLQSLVKSSTADGLPNEDFSGVEMMEGGHTEALEDVESEGHVVNPLVEPATPLGVRRTTGASRSDDVVTQHGDMVDMYDEVEDVWGMDLVTPPPPGLGAEDLILNTNARRAADSSTYDYDSIGGGCGGVGLDLSNGRSTATSVGLSVRTSDSLSRATEHAGQSHREQSIHHPISSSRKVHFRPHAIVLLDEASPSTWMVTASCSGLNQSRSSMSLASSTVNDELGIEPGTPHRLVPLRNGSASAIAAAHKQQSTLPVYRFL